MDIKNCKAYDLIKKERVDELDSEGYILQHRKTKARIVLLENSDNNKVFNIAFRTPPKNSTGVAHIVEHTVLCGSEKFPVKDPFIELVKGSLNTFLNAMTYPDKTMYPVASCNDKDFQNLMDIYLDAVFHPNIYHEEKIFKQEGWHYELEDLDKPLTYNGVVYNEMKGVFSSAEQLLDRNVQKTLFPDTCYGVESGGDPSEIPSLTYEEYLDFHRKYYHPSNSYIYLYGDMDMEEKLNWLNEEYLNQYEYLQVDSEIKAQKPFEKMVESNAFYSVAEGEETEGKAYFSYNVVCGDSLDPNLYLAFQVISHVLVQAVGAPLKQALLAAGLGTEISASYDESIKQPVFMITSKNVKMGQKQEFIDTIRNVLTSLVQEGLNERSLRAAINTMEFHFREADFGTWPKGLMYGLQIFDSWLYDDEKPFIHVKANPTFEFLNQQIGTHYYEDIIQKYLLDNPHCAFVSVEPKVGLTTMMEREEREKLDAYKASLSEEDCRRLVRETKELLDYQEEKTPQEMLACIPILNREDIGTKALGIKNEERQIAQVKVVSHDIFTNGISYIRICFSLKKLLEYSPYLSLLADLLGKMDTDQHEKLELSNELLLHAGNFSVNVLGYNNVKDEKKYSVQMELVTRVLTKETGYVLGLIDELMLHTHLNDTERILEIIGARKSALQDATLAAGHGASVGRACAYLDELSYYEDQMKGIGYYEFLCDLEKNFDERKENLVNTLQQLAKNIFTKENMIVSITSKEDGYQELEKTMIPLIESLPEKANEETVVADWKMKPITKNEGFKTASKVQYVARVGHFQKDNYPYNGVLRVVKTILSYDYLWNEVRVKNGAYGVMCQFRRAGMGFMVSYRDPKLAETNEVFKNVPEYLKEFDATERDMTKYIIGTISEMDTPLTPRYEGYRSFSAYLSNVSYDDVQAERDEVLSVDVSKIHEASTAVENLLSDEVICVIGNEELVKANEELFDVCRTLN